MWVTQRLTADHDLSGFTSGQPELDDWLRREAVRAQRQDVERVYVWTPEHELRVVAFYSIKPTQVAAETVSRGLGGGHSIVPAWLLARLALLTELQGRGAGGQLLRDALEACVTASDQGAGRIIVVDPISVAARDFYLHYDFVDTKAGGGRMAMKVATARSALGLTSS